MTHDPDSFLEEARAADPNLDCSLLRRALEVAAAAHHAQVRASGEAYLVHPLQVALTVARLEQGTDAVAAAVLHDVIEDGGASIEDVERAFGTPVASLVAALSKMSSLDVPLREARQAEYFRRLLLALGEDVRVIVVKLADRLHNLQTLSFLSPDRRRSIAAETLDIYAPLAHQLGMGWFRAQLEDLAFKELDPASYRQIKALVAARRSEREAVIDMLKAPLAALLEREGIPAQITGRVKHFYGIYRKMKLNGKSFEEIFDLVGLRVVTESVEDCYRALGLSHTVWAPVEGRFKDYIASPKPNMYQSVHTTVRTEAGIVVELQIRTSMMERIAEYGVAAHWRYHMAQKGSRYVLSEHFQWYDKLLQNHAAGRDAKDLLRAFRTDVLSAEVLVLTPRNKLIPMRAGSTALDFAFALHSDIGLHCAGARVNGRAVPMDHGLQSGDQVEILTSPSAHPTIDWLARVTGSSARQKIRRYLRRVERERLQVVGKATLLKLLRRLKIPFPKTQSEWEDLARALQYPTLTELFHAVGVGTVGRAQVAALRPSPPALTEPVERAARTVARGVRMGDLRGVAVRFAACCRPIPGDRITAMVTRGRGASVHQVGCANAYRGDVVRWMDVEWDIAQGETFTASLSVLASERRTLLADLESAIQSAQSRLSGLTIVHVADGIGRWLELEVVVKDTGQLDRVLATVKKVPGVREASRGRVRGRAPARPRVAPH